MAVDYKCFAGWELIYNEAVAGWSDLLLTSSAISVVPLGGNEVLWYTGILPGFRTRFFYGTATVVDEVVTRSGPTQFFQGPSVAGTIGANPLFGVDGALLTYGESIDIGDGFSMFGDPLDVEIGGRFLFSGLYGATAGVPGMAGIGVNLQQWASALFLVTWNGSELVVTTETFIGMDSGFLTDLDATVIYYTTVNEWVTAGIRTNPSGYVFWTRTLATWVGTAGSDPFFVGSPNSTVGWGPGVAIRSQMTDACFCGGGILLATVNAATIRTVNAFFPTGVYLYRLDDSLTMGAGVPLHDGLIATADFPISALRLPNTSTVDNGGLPWPSGLSTLLQNNFVVNPPFPGFVGFSGGVDSVLLGMPVPLLIDSAEGFAYNATLGVVLDRIGYGSALVQMFLPLAYNVELGGGPGTLNYQAYGVSDAFGSVSLTPGQFLHADINTDYPTHLAAVFTGSLAAPGTLGFWTPQHSYWTPDSPDEVFGFIRLLSGVVWGVLTAAPAFVPLVATTVDVTTTLPLLAGGSAPPTPVPLQYAALKSGSGGNYVIEGFNTVPIALDEEFNFASTGLSEGVALGSWYMYPGGTVNFSAGTMTGSDLDFFFEWDLTNPDWDFGVLIDPCAPFQTTGGFGAVFAVPPIPVFPVAATLEDGTIVFVGPCAWAELGGFIVVPLVGVSFFLYAGKKATFELSSGIEPPLRVSQRDDQRVAGTGANAPTSRQASNRSGPYTNTYN